MPRRNESIQAYSMNGSPLGVLDIAVDKHTGEGSSAPPSSDNLEAPIEADWEVLQPRTSTNQHSVPFPSLQNTASKSTISPSKLLRKPSAVTLNGGHNTGGGGASSTFKAAIVAGANRVKAKTSSSSLNSRIFGGGHHNASNNNSADFTFQAPSMLSPGKSKTDWENWARSFKAELDGMNMNAEDKRRLERRMMELVQK
jgi:hypothetical protein